LFFLSELLIPLIFSQKASMESRGLRSIVEVQIVECHNVENLPKMSTFLSYPDSLYPAGVRCQLQVVLGWGKLLNASTFSCRQFGCRLLGLRDNIVLPECSPL
jgi:hypothetical protein